MGEGQTTPDLRYALIAADGTWDGTVYTDIDVPIPGDGERIEGIPPDWTDTSSPTNWDEDVQGWTDRPGHGTAGRNLSLLSNTAGSCVDALITYLRTANVITSDDDADSLRNGIVP